jgi:broad specificity phosphatase PhoE
MSIILVRHGETALNAARVLQPAATPLSERGRLQARAVAERVAQNRASVGAIISSDLPRAVETAEAIAAACAMEFDRSPLLQERNFGDLRGTAYDDLDFDPLVMQEAPPGGESVAAFVERVAAALALLCERREALRGDLVVVSHGLVIKTIIERHLALMPGASMPASISNTALTIFAPQAPYQVSVLNCAAHLSDDLREHARALSGL